MSREWTKEELNTASEIMKQKGHMGFEEFCQAIEQKQPVSINLRERVILSILVDTFISKISLPMQPVPEIRSISGA